jgi:hypothetical protein
MPTALLLASAPARAIEGSAPDPSSLLVKISKPAKMIGYPAVCPGSSPEENQEEILCMAELYEAKVRVLRHLGGTVTERYLTIRFTAHSFHAVWRKNVRFLLMVTPFEDKGNRGHFAYYWDWENEEREFCIGADEIDALDPSPLKSLYAAGKKKTANPDDQSWSEGSKIVCVTGYEELVTGG